MPKDIPSLKPKEFIRLLELGGCRFYRKAKEITDCIVVTLRTKRGLSQLIWAKKDFCPFMCSVFLDNVALPILRSKTS